MVLHGTAGVPLSKVPNPKYSHSARQWAGDPFGAEPCLRSSAAGTDSASSQKRGKTVKKLKKKKLGREQLKNKGKALPHVPQKLSASFHIINIHTWHCH